MAKAKAPDVTVEPEPIKTIRAKFQVSSVRNDAGSEDQRVTLQAVTSDNVDGTNENKSFSKFTPYGVMEMLITNPDVEGFFEAGQQFYIDITKAE